MLERTLRTWNYPSEYVGLDVTVYDVPVHVVADGAKLPFRNNSYDMIVLLATLEHIPDYVCCLRECARVLKPGGILFTQSVMCYDRCAYEGDSTHFHTLHPNNLGRLAALFGFSEVERGLIHATFYIVLQKR